MSTFTFGTPKTGTSAFGTGTTTNAFSFGKPATSSTSAFSFGTPGTSAATGQTGLFGAIKPITSTAGTTSTGGFTFGGGLGTTGSVFGAKPAGTSTFGTGTALGVTAPTFGTALGTTGLGTTGFGTTGLGTTGLGTTGFGTIGLGTTGLGTTGFGTTGLGTTGLGTGLGTTGLGTGLGTTTFGTTGQTALGFGQQATGLNQTAVSPMVLTNLALSNPQIHGDERDGIIAKLNQLQAYWGTGKGYYNQQGGAVTFNRENPYCRFKVVGYSRLPSSSNDDGFVGIQIKKKESEVHQQQQALVSELQKCLGNKPTIMVCVDGLKPLPDDSTEVVFKVVERADNGMTKTYPANDVYNALNQINIKTQLQNLGVTNITAKTNMSADLLQQYLNTPPAGIDSLLWEQAKRDNPDPQMLIPVPITGFDGLKKRIEFEEQETAQHQKRLSIITEEVSALQCNHATTMAKLAQFKRKHLELSHRVLEVMVKQESIRKSGYSVQAEEEHLRVHLESLQAELNAPLQFKARLNELLSQIRLQQSQGVGSDRTEGRYTMDPSLQNELKQHLEQQQEGIMHIISIIKDDLEDLKTIEQGLGQSLVVR